MWMIINKNSKHFHRFFLEIIGSSNGIHHISVLQQMIHVSSHIFGLLYIICFWLFFWFMLIISFSSDHIPIFYIFSIISFSSDLQNDLSSIISPLYFLLYHFLLCVLYLYISIYILLYHYQDLQNKNISEFF